MKLHVLSGMFLLATLGCALPVAAQERGISVRDVIQAPEAAWSRFLSDPAYADAYDAYDALGEVGYALLEVDPEACRSKREVLEAAVLKAPVSIALHRARMLCAEVLEDDAVAEEALLAVGALSRLALADGRESFWPRPARVMGPLDIYAVLASSGLEFRYEYYPQIEVQRYFPLVVAAWDEELGAERHLWFDYVDTADQIVRDDPFSGYPAQRRSLADSFRDAMATQGEASAIDLQAIQAFRMAGANVGALAELRPGAEAGGLQSLATWLLVCARQPDKGCDDGWVDFLLPQAEAEHAAYMTLLAMAYATGVGVGQDLKAAAAMLDAADRRWHRDGATVLFARTWILLDGAPPPAFLAQRMEVARQRGNVSVPAVTASWKLAAKGVPQLDQAELRALADPANNGVGRGYALLVNYHRQREEALAANGWLKYASDAGDPDAQAATGIALYGAAKNDAQREDALRLVALGAQGGSAGGARFMAHQGMRRNDWKDAEGWLLAAAVAGNVDALLDLAQIYEWERPGIQGTREQAIETYRSLSEEVDSIEARRRLAGMALEGRGMAKDPAQAERWLRADAEKGDGESAARLGYAHLTGDIPPGDEAEGARWMERSIAAGYTLAYVEYGNWHFYRNGNTLEARRRGIDLWRKGVEAGDGMARNNLAWALCTAPEPELFDAAAGLSEAGRLLETASGMPAWVDTAAACHAAAGDHARAVELQQEVMASLTPAEVEADASREQGFAARLALYRAGKRYVEAHRTEADYD